MRRRELVLFVLFVTAALLLPTTGEAAAASEPSLWGRAVAWVMAQQRAFHRELTDALKALTADGGAAAIWSLVLGSFLYGVFHAAGPGHGKAVLSTYLLTQRERMSRGVAMAAAAALCQGVVAILLVYGLIYAAGWLPRETSQAVTWSERMSYALVAGIGLFLVYRTVRSGYRRYRLRPAAAGAVPGHDHDHDHGDDCGCGHRHVPAAHEVEAAGDIRTAVGVVLSIGMRPCSGAVIVLVFAKAIDFAWAGVGAVLAMSVGTAITVAALAFFAVGARQWATAMTAGRSATWRIAADGVALVGGIAVLALGTSLLAASFAPRHPLGL